MLRTKVFYWVFTGLMALALVFSSIPDIMVTKDAIGIFNHLGFPTYMIAFLGIAKVVGVIVILIPGFPRLKEWAYAGLVFDIGGVIFSLIAIGEPVVHWMPMFIFMALILGSYAFYHKRLREAASAEPKMEAEPA